MGKLKKIYILILLLLLVVSSAAYFSYAYFVSRNEEHGKLNIVAGELKYKIESDSLENNQLTLAANETKDLEINITSLNEIDSKYELYYTSTNDITIYYDSEYELPTGTITSKSTKTIKVQIVNNSDSEATVIFGVQGGLVNHTLSLNQGNKIDTAIPTCQYAVGEVVGTFDYTGSPEEFTAQCDGIYKLEVWGAQGGTYSGGIGGKGGYSSGKVSLTENSSLFVVVGGTGGVIFSSKGNASAGYNGGGQGTSYGQQGNIGTSGGGATHIAMGTTNRGELKNYKDYISELLIIAGGGGGVGNNSLSMNKNGGTGGGLSGGSSSDGNTSVGTQTSGYSFGLGGNGVSYESGSGGGGGGGLYGGYGGWNMGSGTGGSGYIGGVTDGTTENGVRSGNGYAQITYLGEKSSSTCEYAVGDVVGTFDYTGSPEEFTAQCDGIYKLEVWGAQGGNASVSGGSASGGKGGYSYGNVTLTNNSILNIAVGSKGTDSSSTGGTFAGGYNGGGSGYSSSSKGIGAGGGGATHISLGTTNRGELKNYADYKSEVLIVAGGGGGAVIRYFTNNSLSNACDGGTGGGETGGSSTETIGGTYATGGSQTSGYGFGIGANGLSSSVCNGGGGGGYYGGNSTHSSSPYQELSGGGGSGYIGGVANGATESGAHEGNGYAQITYLGENTSYNIGDAVTLTDGSKWHVLEESGNDSKTVTLLSDYNLNPSMTNSSDMYNTTCSSTDYTSCSIAFDPNNTNEYDVNDSNNIGYFIKNTYAKNLLEVLPETTNITLPTAGQIASADNQDFNNQLMYLNSSWLLSTNYWTTTKVENTTDNIWIVYGHASAINTGSPQGAGYAGARPVITVPKKYISN